MMSAEGVEKGKEEVVEATTVSLVAPSDLPEGYELEAQSGKESFHVQVVRQDSSEK